MFLSALTFCVYLFLVWFPWGLGLVSLSVRARCCQVSGLDAQFPSSSTPSLHTLHPDTFTQSLAHQQKNKNFNIIKNLTYIQCSCYTITYCQFWTFTNTKYVAGMPKITYALKLTDLSYKDCNCNFTEDTTSCNSTFQQLINYTVN